MKIYSVILGAFLLGACSLKDQAIVDTNLKSQTLMFTQKYKITQDKIIKSSKFVKFALALAK